MDENIEHASGVQPAKVDSTGMAPPPAQGGNREGDDDDQTREEVLKEQAEHIESGSNEPFHPRGEATPAIGGDASAPSGVTSNVQTDNERQAAEQQQNAPSGDQVIQDAKDRFEQNLENAADALEKMIDSAAGKQTEGGHASFDAHEASALQYAASIVPGFNGSAAASAVQHRITGASVGLVAQNVIDDLIKALAFIRALQNIV